MTPPENWYGMDTIMVTSSDGINEDESEWTIVVAPVNDAPQFSTWMIYRFSKTPVMY